MAKWRPLPLTRLKLRNEIRFANSRGKEGMCQLFFKVETMTVFTQIECTNDQIIQDFVYI